MTAGNKSKEIWTQYDSRMKISQHGIFLPVKMSRYPKLASNFGRILIYYDIFVGELPRCSQPDVSMTLSAGNMTVGLAVMGNLCSYGTRHVNSCHLFANGLSILVPYTLMTLYTLTTADWALSETYAV